MAVCTNDCPTASIRIYREGTIVTAKKTETKPAEPSVADIDEMIDAVDIIREAAAFLAERVPRERQKSIYGRWHDDLKFPADTITNAQEQRRELEVLRSNTLRQNAKGEESGKTLFERLMKAKCNG